MTSVFQSAPAAGKPRRVSWFRRLSRFFSDAVWDMDISALPVPGRVVLRSVRIARLVLNGFWRNQWTLHAAALTYTTLVSVVPIMALGLSVLRGLGAGQLAEQKILTAVSPMPAEFQKFVGDLLVYVDNTSFTALGGVGLAVLLIVAVQMLSQVERAFNRVWGVRSARPLFRMFSDYLSVLVVVPVFMLAATTLNATHFSQIALGFLKENAPFLFKIYSTILGFAPLLATCVAFSVLYKFMPNTRVRIGSAVASGIFGGALWTIWQWFYITLQIGIANYNKIYATFASVFIFLLWVYVSWQIVLLGAEIGFAIQNHATYRMEQRSYGASLKARLVLGLSVLRHAGAALTGLAPAFDVSEFVKAHGVPVRLVNEVVGELARAGYLAELADKQGIYTLLRLPEQVTVGEMLRVFLNSGSDPASLGLAGLDAPVSDLVEKLEITETAGAAGSVTLASLLKGLDAGRIK